MASRSGPSRPDNPPTGPRAPTFSRQRHRPGRHPARQTPSGGRGAGLKQPQTQPPRAVDWGKYRSILLELRMVPRLASTLDLWQSFSKFGTVVYVEIDEDKRGERTGVARVRFEPPPRMNYWVNLQCQLEIKESTCWVVVEAIRPTPIDGAVRSPLGNPVPARVVIQPSRLAFGVLAQPTTFLGMKSIVPPGGPEDVLRLAVDFRRRSLSLFFSVLIRNPRMAERGSFWRQHRMDIKLESLARFYRIDGDDSSKRSIVVTLDSPPKFWIRRADTERTHKDDRLSWGEGDLWARAAEITHDPDASRHAAASLDNDIQIIDLGRWTTYWLDLDGDAARDWMSIERGLADWNIKTRPSSTFRSVPGTRSTLWSLLEGPTSAPRGDTAADLLACPGSISLPFDVRYQLEVCISQGVLEEHNITAEFLVKLAEGANSSVSARTTRARLILEYAADRKKRVFDPMSLFADEAALAFYPNTCHLPHYCALVRKATVTPTRIYFSAPTVETTNRVIRHFHQVQDNFLRVQFTDELHSGRINGSDTERDNQIFMRVLRVLNNGIRMGPWHWQFLAFGNSQIRENGAFFFCQPAGEGAVTCDDIRRWMGQFSHINVVAKYAARLGQCFSTTRLLRSIPAPKVVRIDDVERNDYCFTDGVGKISPFLARMIARDWELETLPPSAYQFRLAGCKGVLVEWPDATGLEVHIRKSQEKFHSEFNGLEIIRCSHFSIATLNRQTITLLSSLGVADRVFVDLLTQQLQSYTRAMSDPPTAVQLLTQYVDENQMTLTVARMILNGFIGTRDPFVATLLQLWRTWSVKALKERARIVVEQGAFVLGCVDETGSLRGYDGKQRRRNEKKTKSLAQIFLQVPDSEKRGEYKVITGLCAVGRNPSLHPGDIRVVEAVDVPALRHLRDVVVFPLVGSRDVPSMCSGGDLDGDDFFVIWDQRLIPDEWHNAPLGYKAPKPEELKRAPTVQDLKNFFTRYMKNNSLPVIAHAHLAQADFMDSGPKDPRCIKLAELHSQAVDYVKTGVEAVMDKKLAPRRWPHFMEKNGKSYHSTKVLGQLYDMVHTVDFRPSYEAPFDSRILKKHNKLPNGVLKTARRIKSQYDTGMRRVMGQLEIKTEFEVWTSFVLSRPRVGTAYKFHETVRRESEALKQQFRDTCVKESGGSRDFESLAPFVAAMYQVTWEEVQIALHESRIDHVRPDGTVGKRPIRPNSMPLISFPWLFDTVLGRIAMGESAPQGLPDLVSLPKPKPMAADSTQQKEGSTGGMADMDCVYTSDGQIVHRGEILRLFHDDGDGDSDFDGNEDWIPSDGESPDEAAADWESSEGLPATSPLDLLTEPFSAEQAASLKPMMEEGASSSYSATHKTTTQDPPDLMDLAVPPPASPVLMATGGLGTRATHSGRGSFTADDNAAGRISATGHSTSEDISDRDDLFSAGVEGKEEAEHFAEKSSGGKAPLPAGKATTPCTSTPIQPLIADSGANGKKPASHGTVGITHSRAARGEFGHPKHEPEQGLPKLGSRAWSTETEPRMGKRTELEAPTTKAKTHDTATAYDYPTTPELGNAKTPQWDWTELSPRAADLMARQPEPLYTNTPSTGLIDMQTATQPSHLGATTDMVGSADDDNSEVEFAEEDLDIPELSAMDRFKQMMLDE